METIYDVLHWLADQGAKLAGQAEAKVVHDTIDQLAGVKPTATPSPAAQPATPEGNEITREA